MPVSIWRPCKTAAGCAAALVLFACAAPQTSPSTGREAAVVTGITAGRASVAGEKSYVLRTAGGRVYFVSQVLAKPLKEGDSVLLEFAPNGAVRIGER
jgi:hypothetical protein